MKVYIVTDWDHPAGVFSTRAKAQARVELLTDRWLENQDEYCDEPAAFEILECEVK